MSRFWASVNIFFKVIALKTEHYKDAKMNPSSVSKGGCMGARFSARSTTSSSSTSSSGNDTFRLYESRREDALVVHDLNLEASTNWLLKNSLSDCVYQDGKKSLRRNMTEIKTCKEVYTGKMVSYLQID